MPKRIPVEIEDRVVSLYVNENISIEKTQARLAAEGVIVGTNWIRRSLLKRGLVRSIKTAQSIAMNVRRVPLQCQACTRAFQGKQVNEKFCPTCSPTPQARKRLYYYGLQEVEYQRMLTAQDHKCAICDELFTNIPCFKGRQSSIIVDHVHETGVVRGLVCHDCNIAIGYIEKYSRYTLNKILAYLKGAHHVQVNQSRQRRLHH